jgi:hypothetical protein
MKKKQIDPNGKLEMYLNKKDDDNNGWGGRNYVQTKTYRFSYLLYIYSVYNIYIYCICILHSSPSLHYNCIIISISYITYLYII